VQDDAVVSRGFFDDDKSDSRRRLVGLLNVANLDALIPIELQRHITESILADLRDEGHGGAQPGTANGLVRSRATVVNAIASAEKRFTGVGQTLDLHGETGRLTSNDGDGGAAQQSGLRGQNWSEEPVSLPQRSSAAARVLTLWNATARFR